MEGSRACRFHFSVCFFQGLTDWNVSVNVSSHKHLVHQRERKRERWAHGALVPGTCLLPEFFTGTVTSGWGIQLSGPGWESILAILVFARSQEFRRMLICFSSSFSYTDNNIITLSFYSASQYTDHRVQEGSWVIWDNYLFFFFFLSRSSISVNQRCGKPRPQKN